MILSGDDFVEVMTSLVSRVTPDLEYLIGGMLRDGHPPGTIKMNEREMYDRLQRLSMERHPGVVENPDAIAEMQRLSEKFGAPPQTPVLPPRPRGM